MPEMNLKLLFGIMLSAGIGTGTVFAIHEVQKPRIATALLWQSRHAEEQGQIERAERFLTRYLEFNPHDNDQKKRLARLLTSETYAGRPKPRRRAVGLLNDILAADGNQPELRRLLVKTALELGEIKEARDHLKILWGADEENAEASGFKLPTSERGEIEGYWGMLLEFPNENKLRRAIDFYRLAVVDSPNEPENYARLAYLLRQVPNDDVQTRLKWQEEANTLLDTLVDKNKESAQAYLARWRYRLNFNLIAAKGLKEPGKVPLEHDEWSLNCLNLTIERRGAAQDVVDAKTKAPKMPEVLLAAAEKERLLHNRGEARKHLENGLAQMTNQGRRDAFQFQFLYHLANLHLDEAFDSTTPEPARQVAIQAATRRLNELRKTRLAPLACEFIEARFAYQEHNWARAVELFEHARPEMSKQADMAITIDLYLGQAYERLESVVQSMAAFDRVLALEPRSLAARLGRAWALWQQGKLDEAAADYRKIATAENLPARIVLDIARVEVQRQLMKDPSERRWAECDRALDTAQELADTYPANAPEVAVLWAERYVADGQMDKAMTVLIQARGLVSAKDPMLIGAQVDLALRAKKLDAAQAIVDAAQQQLGDTVDFRLARARIALARPDTSKRSAELTLAEHDWKKLSEDDQAQLLDGLAELQFRANDIEEGRRLVGLLAGLERYKTDLKLRLLLFDLAARAKESMGDKEGMGDKVGMRQALEEIQTIEQGQGEFYRYGQAVLLVCEARQQKAESKRAPYLAEASKLLNDVANRRQTWAPVFLARAEVAELSGHPERAINEYKRAVENGEQNVQVIERLVMLLEDGRRTGEIKVLTERLKARQLADSMLGLLAANNQIRLGDPAKALERVVSTDSKNVKLLIEQSRTIEIAIAEYKRNPDLKAAKSVEQLEKDALTNLERATNLAPTNPEPWIAIVSFLARHQDLPAARARMNESVGKVSAERKSIVRAMCLEAMNDKDCGVAYADALEERPADLGVVRTVAKFYLRAGRLADAEIQLARLMSPELGATEAESQWARNTLAIVLASGTDYKRFGEALKLVSLSLDGDGHLLPEKDAFPPGTGLMRTRAHVLAAQPQRQFRERAIQLLEALDAEKALTPDDRFILARLQDQGQVWQKAREHYQNLAADAPSPPYLVAYIQGLIRTGNLNEAEAKINQLKRLEELNKVTPGTFGTVDLHARWLEATGKPDQAIKELELHRTTTDSKLPEGTLALIAALARQKKYKDAYQEIMKAWDRGLAPESLGGSSVALLRDMSPEEPQVARIEDFLRKAIAKEPKKLVLRMHLADLYDLRGDFDGAINQYREILKPENEPNNVIALNNLSWLLAEHAGQGDEALRYVNTAIAGLGQRADLLDTRGIIQLKRNQTAEAIVDLKAAAAEQATAIRLFHLARAYHQAHDRNEAARVLRQACTEAKLTTLELHPKERQICKNLLAEYQLKEYGAR